MLHSRQLEIHPRNSSSREILFNFYFSPSRLLAMRIYLSPLKRKTKIILGKNDASSMMTIFELPHTSKRRKWKKRLVRKQSSIGRDAKDCGHFCIVLYTGNPRGGKRGRVVVARRGGGGRGGRRGEEGWGCGGRFSNNYIELRWWWVAMVTAVPSVSYD